MKVTEVVGVFPLPTPPMAAQPPQQMQNAQSFPGGAALQNLLMHPNLSLEQKIDTLKKLRVENKITEEKFQQLVSPSYSLEILYC
jgi:hypothetical protein